MTDEGEGDDPALRSLRAVWLSMPDEDPPERGLAELMAAARVKAEEMAQPPWWQRIGQLLRRPSVLAFATVMLLVGGAALIGRRGDEMQAKPPATRTEVTQPAAPAADRAAAPASAEAVGGAKQAGDLEEKPVVELAPAPEPASAPAAEQRRPARRPRNAAPASSTTTTAPAGPSLDQAEQAAPAETSTADTKEAQVKADATGARELSAAPTPTEPPVSARELHSQARAAAARNDCGTVRSLVTRIARLDASYHKTKVTPDPALATCLRR